MLIGIGVLGGILVLASRTGAAARQYEEMSLGLKLSTSVLNNGLDGFSLTTSKMSLQRGKLFYEEHKGRQKGVSWYNTMRALIEPFSFERWIQSGQEVGALNSAIISKHRVRCTRVPKRSFSKQYPSCLSCHWLAAIPSNYLHGYFLQGCIKWRMRAVAMSRGTGISKEAAPG